MYWRYVFLVGLGSLLASPVGGQYPPGQQGSTNIDILAHIGLGRQFTVTDVELEQELSRPFAYVSRMHGSTHSAGLNIIDVRDPGRPRILYYWRIGEPELHRGVGAMDNKYFKLGGRYYDIQSFQFVTASPDADLGAVVLDVTGLPDTSLIEEVGRIRAADTPGGFHNIFAYKHSDGRVLLFTTTAGRHANVYDMGRFLAGDPNAGLVSRIPLPDDPSTYRVYHDLYVGYDPASRQDKFYGAGGAYFVFDVSLPETPSLLTTVAGVAGITRGHTFTPTPDGRHALESTAYQFAPVRVFDLEPGLEGDVQTVSRPVGAWTPDWRNVVHNLEVRWPYVFVAGYEDGLHVINVMDPANPYSVGYYDTYEGPHQRGFGGIDDPENGTVVDNGAFGVDVRNADGLIVVGDMYTGFWTMRMDGFDGWNGHGWGVPNISSAQDWDNGPDGATGPTRVS